MRRHLFTPLLLAVAAGTVIGGAHGDTLALRGGDVLSGRLLSICDGTIVFQTSLSGQMMAPVDEVVALTTDEYVNVSVDGAPPSPARFAQQKDAFRLAYRDGSAATIAGLGTVTAANPLPEETTTVDWEAGVLWRSGHEDYTDVFGRLGLLRETDSFGIRSQWLIERADPETFPRRLLSYTEWRLGLRDKLAPMLSLELERDAEAGLALRGDLNFGAGKRLFDSASQSLDAAFGIGGTIARYDADIAGPEDGSSVFHRRLSEEKEIERIQLRLRLRYLHALLGNGSIEEELVLYPSLSDPGELRARSESAMLFPLTSRLHVKLDLLIDFDSAPEFDRLDEWRTSVGASLLWRF